MRRALGLPLAALVLLGPCMAGAEPLPSPVAERPAPADRPEAQAPWPVRAEYVAPTDRYPHGVLGRVQGWGGLVVDLQPCPACEPVRSRMDLPEARVFEDLAPRLWDVTGDGRPEVVVIESDAERGARLVVLEARPDAGGDGPLVALRAATPFIGTRFRWLAPLGAADFTGDGVAEIAYVETPHLGRILRLVTLEGDRLVEIARLEGVTNHAIGEERIEGGIRVCGGRPEIIARSGDRSQVLAIRYEQGALVPRVLGPAGEEGLDRALACAP